MPDRSNQNFTTLMLTTVGKKMLVWCYCNYFMYWGEDILSLLFNTYENYILSLLKSDQKRKDQAPHCQEQLAMQTQFGKQQICRKVSWSDDESHP